MNRIEIHVSASIPSDNNELGHEAVVATKAPITAVVDALTALGLTDVVRKSRLAHRTGPRAKAAPPPTAPAPASDADEEAA
jgi:hypothetical protein